MLLVADLHDMCVHKRAKQSHAGSWQLSRTHGLVLHDVNLRSALYNHVSSE